MRVFLSKIYDVGGYLAGASVLAIFVIMIGSTVMRGFGVATGGTDDIVAWLAAAAALLAMAHTFQHGDMVRMTLVLEQLPAPARRWAEVLALLIGTIACTYLAYWVSFSVHESWLLEDMSNGLIVIPLWIPQLILLIGAVLLAVALLDELLWVLAGNVPRYVSAVQQRRAGGDFGEGA
jgi:TRAP-type C4-dicarboxylate transport system permease small subunit